MEAEVASGSRAASAKAVTQTPALMVVLDRVKVAARVVEKTGRRSPRNLTRRRSDDRERSPEGSC